MKYLLTLVSTLLLFTACSKSESNEPEDPMGQRTVMVYMSGDNDLSSYAQMDINEMIAGASNIPSRNNLVLFVDRQKTGERPFIAKVTANQQQPLDTLYKYSSDFYACDPEKFSAVLQRMTTLCPAREYGLVLWGHASGWVVPTDTIAQTSKRAYGKDGSKWMNITQMAVALKSLPKMKFIFADCCNMMCAEVGYELRNATEYLIGSPCEIPGNGAPYDQVLPHLFKDGTALYKGIIDAYYEGYNSTATFGIPLSVIDTKYISNLAVATAEILEQTKGGYPQKPDAPDLSGIAFTFGYDVKMMYDMRAVIERLVPTDAFKQWDSVFQQAVPYYRMSMRWMTNFDGRSGTYDLLSAFDTFDPTLSYGCVTMFLPHTGYGYEKGDLVYNERSKNFSWTHIMNWSRFGW